MNELKPRPLERQRQSMKSWLGLFIVLYSSPSIAAVTYDASASITYINGITYPVTVGSNSNRALAVFVHNAILSGNTPQTVASVTYAGVALTKITSINNTGAGAVTSDSELWALPAGTQPASGTNNVVITLSGAIDESNEATLLSGAIAAYNVDQTTTFTSTSTNGGSGTSAAVTLPSSGANDLVIDSVCTGSGISSTPQTQQWDDTSLGMGSPNSCGATSGATAAGGTTSLSWNIINDYWQIVAGSFKAVGGQTATLDTAVTAVTAGKHFASYPLTVGAGANRALAVFAYVGTKGGVAEPTVSSVSYAGVALTQILTKSPATNANAYLYALPAGTQPTSGTGNVVITLSGLMMPDSGGARGDFQSGAISVTGVDQSTTFTSSASASGSSTTPSVTLASSGANDLVIQSIGSNGTLNTTPQTQRWKYTSALADSFQTCGGATAAGGTTSLSWTYTSGSHVWAMLAASFKAASTASLYRRRTTTY